MIKFVHSGGSLFIGDIYSEKPNILVAPFIVIAIPVSSKVINVEYLPVIGEPKEIELHEKSYSYDVKNDELVRKYVQKITGLILAPSGVASITGGKEKMN